MAATIRFTRYAAGVVPYALLEGYPIITFTDEQATGSESYVMHKDSLLPMYHVSMPPPVVFGNTVIVPPRRGMPGAVELSTKSMKFSPFLPDLTQDPFRYFEQFGEIDYNEYVKCDIEYETRGTESDRDDQDPETFLEFSFDATADLLKVPTKATHYGDDVSYYSQNNPTAVNVDGEVPATIIVPTTTYSINWKLVLNPNFNVFRSMLGHVNGVADSLFFNAPPETILFLGYSGSRSFLYSGTGVTVTPWNLTFKFGGKHITQGGATKGWNHVFRGSTGAWEKIKKADGGWLYPSISNWSQMFLSGGI